MRILRLVKFLIQKKVLQFIIIAVLFLITLDLIFPLPSAKEYSMTIFAKDGTMLTSYLTSDHKWRMRTEPEDISPDLIKAIIFKEDKNFFSHFGFDLFAISRSFINNLFFHKKISGASTITMQVVRILEPKERTYLNKFLEIIRAIQFEIHYSKKEILSIYLSHLPLGGNIEGIKSAAYIYFNQHPRTLSLSQSIILALIPSNPNKLRIDRINDNIKPQRDYWIKRFKESKIFSDKILTDALNEPIIPHRYPVSKKAPHFCYFLKNNAKQNNDLVYSTLDLKIQQTTEDILSNYINRIRSKKISNGAVIVIDNKNATVVGYCGSADFNDKRHQGEVNGVLAVRSPGSTLKPALYAEAFEQGFLTPGTKLLDVPIEINGFEPENFDTKYNGFVSAEYALVNSLNIPAVLLLNQIGMNNFIEVLDGAEFNQIKKQKDKLGLSLILGGCGVTLEELARLYSVFARDGKFQELCYTKDQIEINNKKYFFSKETCYLISDILAGLQRNDKSADLDFSKLPKFAWKTGTSYGKRDAWAIGFNPDYTIAVWVGNFNGEASPFLIGADSALPLLAELFRSIDYNSKKKWFDKPQDVYQRKVCAVSGLIPTDLCKEYTLELAIKNRSHNNFCNVHQKIFVNNDETIQYCKACLPDSNYKVKIYEVFDPRLVTYFKNNNIQIEDIPKHNPDCYEKNTGKGPHIISPSASFEYLIDENDPQEIALFASNDSEAKVNYWYINDKLFGKASVDQKLFYKLSVGKFKITCLDEEGKSQTIYINVKGY